MKLKEVISPKYRAFWVLRRCLMLSNLFCYLFNSLIVLTILIPIESLLTKSIITFVLFLMALYNCFEALWTLKNEGLFSKNSFTNSFNIAGIFLYYI